jgi:hypothetical protein
MATAPTKKGGARVNERTPKHLTYTHQQLY